VKEQGEKRINSNTSRDFNQARGNSKEQSELYKKQNNPQTNRMNWEAKWKELSIFRLTN